MNRKEHINALAKLGGFIDAWLPGDKGRCDNMVESGSFADFNGAVRLALSENEWFTEEGIRKSLAAISSEMLDEVKLQAWLQSYPYKDADASEKPVGIVAAGNIPLVCFHDIICVLLSGHKLLLKPSSKDKALVCKVMELLLIFEPKLKDRIELSDSIKQSDIGRLIATGSNNTARYIDYEYSYIPVLSRKNRASIAILTGNETDKDLQLLSDDIFSYFGMGCRNVSKLYVPEGYDFAPFLDTAKKWAENEQLGQQKKYSRSYRYERAISLSLAEQLVDGEFFLLKENKTFNSPLSVIYYEFFSNLDTVKNQLIQNAELLQCAASANGMLGNIRFGQTQKPSLADYADGVDTMQWLTNNIK